MKKTFTTKNIVLIAMFSALALVLHLFDFSIPVIAPEFYKLDLSEIPVLINSLRWRFGKLHNWLCICCSCKFNIQV